MTRVSTKSGPRITVSPSTKGAISEHIATAWLLASGFDVFRNVSPNGRADLLAVDWQKNETIRVDVKSRGFSLVQGTCSARLADAIDTDRVNQGFDIKYLVVQDNGDCNWYSEETPAANDNEPRIKWFVDTKTGQRFLAPGFDMSRKEWSYFCHWLVRAYPDYVVPFSEDFVRSISARGIGRDNFTINEREFSTLEKLRKNIYDKLTYADSISFIHEVVA